MKELALGLPATPLRQRIVCPSDPLLFIFRFVFRNVTMLDFLLLLLLTLLYILGLLNHSLGHGMAQQIKLHIAKPDDFSSIPRAQMVKDNQFS